MGAMSARVVLRCTTVVLGAKQWLGPVTFSIAKEPEMCVLPAAVQLRSMSTGQEVPPTSGEIYSFLAALSPDIGTKQNFTVE